MVCEVQTFTRQTWKEIVDTVSEIFGLNEEEKERFAVARVPKLIGATPFVAGCRQPMRTALSHLATYMMATRSRVFYHSSEDYDPYARLSLILNFDGGDPDVLRSSRGRLGLISYANHLHDMEFDRMTGKYNPILAGDWDESTRDLFCMDAEAAVVAELDEIVTADSAAYAPWWMY